MRVAIFDFDGTLYKKETFPVLMNHLKKHPLYSNRYRRFFRTILPPYIGYKLKVYPENKMRERSMQIYLSSLNGLSTEEVYGFFSELADKMKEDYNQQVVEQLNHHTANGDCIMLVSGAFMPLLEEATKTYHVDKIIGTEVPFAENKFDGTAAIYHIQGQRKKEQIEQALENTDIDWENSYAYADSFSDLPVLEMVGNPVAVQPEPRLKAAAKERKWKII
ncbi:HAD family hydrolase [Virgibacillus kimchii]